METETAASTNVIELGRLYQGPFQIEQDNGWYTIFMTTPSSEPIRNPGMGLIAYAWEENGPSLNARNGLETIEEHVEQLAKLPYVDVLYIRCDWRHVQTEAGSLNLHPIWETTLRAAEKHGLRVAFRIQLSSPNPQPQRLAMPDFLIGQVPLVNIGRFPGHDYDYLEPRYDHPAFQAAFQELNELLAARFDGDPRIEFVDLMMYGFWGEGHTNDLKNPFPDYATAEHTFMRMTRQQIERWKHTPLAVNTQPDISQTGNRIVREYAMNEACWVRTDSIVLDEPEQIEAIANRSPWTAAVIEDGYYRHFKLSSLAFDTANIDVIANSMLHALDIGGNYWGLWTEAAAIADYHERYPAGIETLRRRLGYRLRPSWIWQRKRFGTDELVVALANDGVSGVPGTLWLEAADPEGTVKLRGKLDKGSPIPGKVSLASMILPQDWHGKEIRLALQLEVKPGVCKPVQWACAQPTEPDGSLAIRLKDHSDTNWRCGV
ncbi:hypothetical protein GZH47_30895 [Paenibacillus rhizovicinus]|uniref:DUF4832 domain-containing protein n=1 Tax=Paenibacillus rhizovicinus TaxID=2704463 RepID=A0A6C0P8Q3_9BACL|nr:hypothetical protein [Paenibacillus rhizovicinus]QHW34771.1 hypothetical protein GZH47_30895 [Paenibacillus rhizovicinus]